MSAPISVDKLRALVSYEPSTGLFTWLARGNKSFDNRFCGKPAFTYATSHGYKAAFLNGGKIVYAHRAAYAIMTGQWPVDQIDHIDQNKTNNKWSNLRAATNAQNNRNISARNTGTSKYKGVHWFKRKGKWQAQIRCNGKRQHLGYFHDEKDAHEAYQKAAKLLHGEWMPKR